MPTDAGRLGRAVPPRRNRCLRPRSGLSCLRDIEVALAAGRRARRAGAPVDVPDEGAFEPVAHQGGPPGRPGRDVVVRGGGRADGALEAASLGAGFASRLGEISLAAELAARCILGMGCFDDSLVAEVANRLGIFCYSFLDYDRAIEQFEVALGCRGALRRCLEDLPPAAQHRRCAAAGGPPGPGIRPKRTAATTASGRTGWKKPSRPWTACSKRPSRDEGQLGVQRLQAELLVEQGRPAEALEVISRPPAGAGAIVWAAGRADRRWWRRDACGPWAGPAEAVAAASRAAGARRAERRPSRA